MRKRRAIDERKLELLQAYVRYLVGLLRASGEDVPPAPTIDGKPVVYLPAED